MQSFYNSFGFLIAFMVLLLFFQMLLGNGFTEKFMLLVILSMVVVNKDKTLYLLSKFDKEA